MAAVLSLLSLSRPRVHGVRSSTLASMCTKSLCGGGGRHLQHTHYIRLEIRICDRRGPGWRSGRNLEKMARQGGWPPYEGEQKPLEARYWASRTAVYIHCQYSRSNISSGHTLKKARCLYLPMLSDASCDEPQFMCLFRIRVRYAYGAKTHGRLSRVRHSNWAVCIRKVLYLYSVEVSN